MEKEIYNNIDENSHALSNHLNYFNLKFFF